MSFIFSPSQYADRAEFYHQLGHMTRSGIEILRALDQLHHHPPARSYVQPLERVMEEINAGATFSEGLRSCGKWLPEFDLAIIDSGEKSGKLDSSFLMLAEYYSDRASIMRQVITEMAYPAFLLHFAVFILPFADFFISGDSMTYLRRTFGILIPIYVVVIAMIIMGQSRHGERWLAVLEMILRPVPLLGGARRYLAVSRLTTALNALLNAGVNTFHAWDMAAASSGSPAIRRVVRAWLPKLHAGQTPGEMVQSSSVFPYLFANEYCSGEASGRLDECLDHVGRYYKQEGSRKLHAFAQWVPRLLYLAIVITIAARILGFYSNYYGQAGQIFE